MTNLERLSDDRGKKRPIAKDQELGSRHPVAVAEYHLATLGEGRLCEPDEVVPAFA